MPVYVAQSLNTVRDVQEQIVYTDPDGNTIRLKDVARVVKEYPAPDSYITNNGKKCLLLSVEMKKGKNIVEMGEEIDRVLTAFEQELPPEVDIFRITNQSEVVDNSVSTFLSELLIAIAAVIVVVMLLLPMRVALVAASTIPITIFIALGLFYAFGIELNTVTLAALIVTLGMIVDNSIVIIDNYLEKLGEGCSRWHASIESATHFFKSIFSATLAISITFFPFLLIMTGMMHDFMLSFPWAISLVLGISLLVAVLLVPFMQFWFIRKPINTGEKKFSFLDALQRLYNKVLDICFAWPRTTVATGIAFVAIGALLISRIPQRLMPIAERNQFAVEIYLPTGTPLEKTAEVADSLEHILRRDPRVVSVTSFTGCSSPRFHTTYAPQIARPQLCPVHRQHTGQQRDRGSSRRVCPVVHQLLSRSICPLQAAQLQRVGLPGRDTSERRQHRYAAGRGRPDCDTVEKLSRDRPGAHQLLRAAGRHPNRAERRPGLAYGHQQHQRGDDPRHALRQRNPGGQDLGGRLRHCRRAERRKCRLGRLQHSCR